MAFISKSMGAKSYKDVKRASVQSVLVTMVAGVVVGVLTLLISPVLPVWMGVEEKIRQDASLYFAIICSMFSKCDYYFKRQGKGSWRCQNPYAGKCS